MGHNNVIRKAFSKQASSFGNEGLTLSSQEILNWIATSLPLKGNVSVLDVAAGTGHLSRVIAPYVKEVVAIDITREMLAQACKEVSSGNFEHIRLVEGDAEALPYEDHCFDLVVSRLSIHHFQEPILQLREMVRVCKPRHCVGVIDLLSPEDEEIAAAYNRLERLRDPSHTIALTKSQMGRVLGRAGLTVATLETKDIVVDFRKWIQMTKTPTETAKRIQEALLEDVGDGTKTGMRPFTENNELKFWQVWSIFLGRKN